MKVIGLTGGIGSGKSTVAAVFKTLGIPVFDSDNEAKALYDKDEVRQKVYAHFGERVFENKKLSFKKLASIIFSEPTELEWINTLIHPLVQQKFEQWKENKNADFIIKESALLIESQAYKNCDYVVLVEASEETRIKRVIDRDGLTHEDVKKRIDKQMRDKDKKEFADFIILNDNELIIPQVVTIYNELKENCFS